MSSTRKTRERIVPAYTLLPERVDVAAGAVQCAEAAAAAAAAPCTEAAAAAQWEAAAAAEEDAVEAVVSGLQVSASARPRRLDTSTIAIAACSLMPAKSGGAV